MKIAGGGNLPRLRRGIPLRTVIPNAVTVLALCFGLTAVKFAFAAEWEKAVLFVAIAAVLDGIDGRIARLLNGASRFGAELDSLSDLTAFGVAPALIMYFWALQYMPGRIGWVIALAHAVTCALRLARFNAQIDAADQPHKKAGYLTGVPAPVAAALTLSPLAVTFWLEPAALDNLDVRYAFVAVVITGVSFLMASSLPTFGWGAVRLRPAQRLPALIAVGLFAGALFSAPWMTMTFVAIAYVVAIPFAVRSYARLKAREATSTVPPPA